MAKIKVKYTYKLSDRQTESVQTLKNRNYNSVVAKAKTYNKDTDNDIYISEITNLDAEPRHTTCLGYTPKDTKANDFNLSLQRNQHILIHFMIVLVRNDKTIY